MSGDTPRTALRAAAVQFRSSGDLGDNLTRIGKHLEALAAEGVRVAAFPECAATSYAAAAVERCTPQELADAERALADMCRRIGIYAVVGIPYFEDGARYNGALVWDPVGRLIARYAKIQLAGEPWCAPGRRFTLFRIDGIVCCVIICHDERYPELVRLPVLAGAQVVFYVSCESGMREETKLDPYRAQIQARAMENGVYVVHSNAPADIHADGSVADRRSASHGQSRIIAPDGNLISEASFFQEERLVADLDPARATRNLARRSAESPLLKEWWETGLRLVPPAEG